MFSFGIVVTRQSGYLSCYNFAGIMNPAMSTPTTIRIEVPDANDKEQLIK